MSMKVPAQAEEIVTTIYASFMSRRSGIDPSLHDGLTRDREQAKALYRKCGVHDLCVPTAVVTGSKGKGTVARLIERLLYAQGLRTGLFTSPHQQRYTERVRVNGEEVDWEAFIKAGQPVAACLPDLDLAVARGRYIGPMSGWLALALRAFQAAGTDAHVLECGRGARYDDVTLVTAQAAAINRIFLEHSPYLGTTTEDVAWHKAGIIQKGMHGVAVAPQEPEVMAIIEKEAGERGVPLWRVGRELQYADLRQEGTGWCCSLVTPGRVYRDVTILGLPLYAVENTLLALGTAELILGQALDEEAVRHALGVFSFQGCLERVQGAPDIYLDGCIHGFCAESITRTVDYRFGKKAVYVLGVPDNKDYAGVLDEISRKADHILLTTAQEVHLPFSDAPYVYATKRDMKQVLWEPDSRAALEKAKEFAQMNNCPVIMLGTQLWLGQVKTILGEEE